MCLGLGTALGSRMLAFWWLKCSVEEREGGGDIQWNRFYVSTNNADLQ